MQDNFTCCCFPVCLSNARIILDYFTDTKELLIRFRLFCNFVILQKCFTKEVTYRCFLLIKYNRMLHFRYFLLIVLNTTCIFLGQKKFYFI